MHQLTEQIAQVVEHDSAVTDRRGLFRKAGLLTTAAVAGTVGSTAVATPAGATTARRLRAVDVAVDISTLTVVPTDSPVAVPLGFPPQGSPFYVEGAVFRRGTIPVGPGFDYEANLSNAIGTWLCYGHFISRADRSSPHLVSTQIYTLNLLTDEKPFPRAQLVSHGFEGADDPGDAPLRPLIGGTGPYSGAIGSVRQRQIGTNTTTHPAGLQGATVRFRFHYA